MIGRTLGHYRLLEQIGAGGMGVVYRARDMHLDRDVAVKVLPAGVLADEPARERFRREAVTLSRLNHPSIATIHDFDTQEGVDFLVMELVAGTPLDQRLREGRFAEAEVRSIGVQIAEALEAAHEQGIVHRDLKPGNVVLTAKNRVKVLDFGLARLLGPAEGADLARSLTDTGVTVGTVPYMAPEQLLGRKVDARADLYALGVTLYEMATGRSPYRETIPTALIYEIVNQPIAPPRSERPDLSEQLESIISRCLAKEPERRYASAREVSLDLGEPARAVAPATVAHPPGPGRALALGAAAAVAVVAIGLALLLDIGGLRARLVPRATVPAVQALAVLPFENLSRDSSQAYFVDGTTDELITRLTQVAALRVRPRESVMPLLGTTASLPELGRRLRVDAVVTGSVLLSGGKARISARLVRTRDQVNLWADSFEGDLKDVLALQGRVARAVVEHIRVSLSGAESARLGESKPVDPRAHDAYLRGQYLLSSFAPKTSDANQQALRYFNQAIAFDPTYAQAYVGLASAYFTLSSIYEPANVAMPKARAAAQRALGLDPTNGDAYGWLATVKAFYDWDRSGAEADFRKAIELQPGSATVHAGYAGLLTQAGRLEQARIESQRAYDIDPLSPNSEIGRAVVMHYAGEYDAAIAALRKVLVARPDVFQAHAIIGQCLLWKKDVAGGLAEIRESHRQADLPITLAWLGYACAASGRTAEARQALAELEARSRKEFVETFCFALVYTGLGDKDRAFEWLERGVAVRAEDMGSIQVDRSMDPLRSDPRYRILLGKMGFIEGVRAEPPGQVR